MVEKAMEMVGEEITPANTKVYICGYQGTIDGVIEYLGPKGFVTKEEKRKDGSYIHILSQSSVYELDAKGNLLKSYTKLSDISYLNISTPVSWSVRSNNMDNAFIQSKLFNIFENPFTKREIEIIKEIQIGGTNKEIAERLFVSHHTIATHRKHIFQKCNCHSVVDLLLYCQQLNII